MSTCNSTLQRSRAMTLIGSSAHTYYTIPRLGKPENNVLLLLIWNTLVFCPFKGLSDWTHSKDFWNLYKQLAEEFQVSQSVEQLALIMAPLMSRRRLRPDFLDYFDQPIRGSYLADLNTVLRSESLGNSGRVAEQMVFSLVRELSSSGDQFNDLIAFLETALDRELPPLHVFDGFNNRYLGLRMAGQPYQTAIEELSHVKVAELGGVDDLDWINVTLST